MEEIQSREISLRLNEHESVRAALCQRRWTTQHYVILAISIVGMLSLAAIFGVQKMHRAYLSIILLFFIILLVIFIKQMSVAQRARRDFRKNPPPTQYFYYESEGYKTSSAQALQAWSTLACWREDDHQVMLKPAEQDWIVFPNRVEKEGFDLEGLRHTLNTAFRAPE